MNAIGHDREGLLDMRWELTTEQVEIRDELTGWLGHVATAEAVRQWDQEGPAAYDAAFVDAGWFAAGVPEANGGAGGGLLQQALLAEAMGMVAPPTGSWLAAGAVQPALVDAGSNLLDEIVGGAAVALAVPAEGAPDQVLVRPARLPRYASGRIEGSVSLVLGAARGATLIVPVVADDGVRLAVVPDDEGAVALTPRPLLDATRFAADVTFAGAAATLLDLDAGQVAAALTRCSLHAAVLVAADALGASQRMLDLAVTYSKQREQFGKPIGSFQAVKHAAATVLVGIEAGRSIIYPAALAVDQSHEMAVRWVSAAKAQIGASAVAAADSALTMHGAIGYTWEHELHRFYKRAKLDARLFGSSSAWNERLADQLELVGVTGRVS